MISQSIRLCRRILAHIFIKTCRWLPDKPYLQILYLLKMGSVLHLKNPSTYNEKINWLKLYNRKPEYTMMVDKYAVKDYVAKKIGREHVIPTLGAWDTPEAIISKKDSILPSDPYQYCLYYRKIRDTIGKLDPTMVMKINLEDMIYKYTDTIPKIFEFVGIDKMHHVNPQNHFDPEISINGTQLWKKHSEFTEAVSVIERELPEYLYSY